MATKTSGELNPKQVRFIQEYLVDLNATRAATRAGYAHPGPQGARLLKNVKVQAEIVKSQADRSKRTAIDSDWVLKRLAEEAEADIADLYDADTGALRPVKDWPLVWRKGLVTGIDVAEERDRDSESEGGTVTTIRKLKLSDRVKRLELIGKHVNVQAFRDQVKHEGGISLTISQEDAKL